MSPAGAKAQLAPVTPVASDAPKRLPRTGRKPPKEGPCKRCGKDNPLNRLMLCYPCWVKTRLEKDGWREGLPHPESCNCEGLGQHVRPDGGPRGAN